MKTVQHYDKTIIRIESKRNERQAVPWSACNERWFIYRTWREANVCLSSVSSHCQPIRHVTAAFATGLCQPINFVLEYSNECFSEYSNSFPNLPNLAFLSTSKFVLCYSARDIINSRTTGTVHTSTKARLTSVAIRIWIRHPDRRRNVAICSLAHCQRCPKISCKSVQKFLRKVANRQTDRQTNNDDYIWHVFISTRTHQEMR